MSEQKRYQNQQTIGRYEIFMHDQDVVIFHPGLESTRILTAQEALQFLEWLQSHQASLVNAAKRATALYAQQ